MTPRRSSVDHPPCTTGPIMTAVRNRSAQQYTTIYAVFRWLLELGTVTSKKVAICRRPTNLRWYANSVVEVCHTAQQQFFDGEIATHHTTEGVGANATQKGAIIGDPCVVMVFEVGQDCTGPSLHSEVLQETKPICNVKVICTASRRLLGSFRWLTSCN